MGDERTTIATLAMTLCVVIAIAMFYFFACRELKKEIKRLREENWILRQMVGADEEDSDDGDQYVM